MTKRTRLKSYNSDRSALIQCAAVSDIQSDEGKTPTAEIVAYTGEKMQLDGFQHPVVVDLDTLVIPERPIAILLNHDHDKSVGHSTRIGIEDYHLKISAALSAATEAKREVVDSAKSDFPWGASLTVDFGQVRKVARGETIAVNGREVSGPVNVIYRSRLRETSFVPVGGDINATAIVSANVGQKGEDDMTIEAFAAALGVSLEGISDDEMAKLTAAFEAMYGEAEEEKEAASAEGDGTDEEKETASAAGDATDEEKETASAAVRPTVQASANHTQRQLDAIRASAATPPPVRVSTRPDRGRVIQAAVCQTYGIDDEVLAKDYTADELTEASSREFRGFGIKRAFIETLKAGGVSVNVDTFGPEHVPMAFQMRPTAAASGFSTSSLPNLLGAVANKRLLQDFTRRESAAVKLMASDSVKNYQVHTAIRPTMAGDLSEVGTDGEIKHMSMGEETYTNQAKLYAGMLQLAEQHVVNDELNGFLKNADKLSYAAFKHRENAFFTLLLANASSFYASGNGNLVAAASVEALSIDGLDAANTLFMKQTDSNGDPIDVSPKILLVPPELYITAKNLMNSTHVNEAATAGSPAPSSNPFAGAFEVVQSSRMSNTNFTGYSTTAWYLFASPQDLPAYEIVYLNGQSTPTVETETASFNQFGVQMRVSYRYGIGEVDYRGAVKSDGAD